MKMFKDLKKMMGIMNAERETSQKKVETLKLKNQMEIPKLKFTVSEIKGSLHKLSSRLAILDKRVMNFKTYQQKLSIVKKRENYF